MSFGEDTRKIAVIKKCPDCGKNNLIIYTNGTVHCGNCLMGGMLPAKKYKHLLADKEIIEKVKNEYVFKGNPSRACFKPNTP